VKFGSLRKTVVPFFSYDLIVYAPPVTIGRFCSGWYVFRPLPVPTAYFSHTCFGRIQPCSSTARTFPTGFL
jgi:hypothetical protein